MYKRQAVLFFQGSYANAIPQLRAALKLRPTLWKTQALLGIGEKRTGDIDAARRDLEKVFPKLPEEKIRIETGMELIEIYSETGDLDKSAAIVGVLRKLEPVSYTHLRGPDRPDASAPARRRGGDREQYWLLP